MTSSSEETTVVCIGSFANDAGIGVRGRTYPHDHPLVIAAPKMFKPASTPMWEWGTDLDGVVESYERAGAEANAARIEAARANRVRLTLRVWRATRDVTDLAHGRTILKNSTIGEDDDLLLQHPDCFEEVTA
ncbi:MAG TPA: hypothetical protein VLV46_06560 [Gaiellaceae bacterium]|nr:hypothetical protein [Gaiellaceae bacterium]